MTLDTYKVFTDDKGKKFVQQNLDEMDKNHTAYDTNWPMMPKCMKIQVFITVHLRFISSKPKVDTC